MENIDGFYKLVVNVKGKPVERLVSKYDKNIIIAPETSASDKAKLIALSNKKSAQGFTSLGLVYGNDTLQSPNNKWITQEDGFYYKLPETPKGKPEKKSGSLINRIDIIDGTLVYARYGDNIVKFIKTGKNAPYNFINVDEAKVIPYHLYILKKKNEYIKDNPSLVSWAENVNKGIVSNPPSVNSSSSFNGRMMSRMAKPQINTDESSFISASMLDFSGGNSNMLDNDIVSKFAGSRFRSIGRQRKPEPPQEESSFTGGAMPDFNGGTDSDFCGDSNFTSNVGLDLSADGGQSNFSSNIGLDLGFDGDSNMVGIGKAKSTQESGKFVNEGGIYTRKGFHKIGTVKHVKEITTVDFKYPNGKVEKRKIIIFADGTGSNPAKWENTSSNFSSNVGLDLGIDGKSSPTSIKDFQSWYNKNKGGKLTEDGKWGANTSKAWNASKSDYTKIATTPIKLDVKSPEPTLAESKDKVVFTEAELKALYAKSGSKAKFADWVKSDSAKNLANSAKDVALAILAARGAKKGSSTSSTSTDNSGGGYTDNGSSPDTTEKKILGMHPVTFGITATILGIAVIGGIIWYSKHKAKVPVTV